MDNAAPFFIFLVIAAVVGGLIYLGVQYSIKQAKELGEVYARLAERFGGTADRGSMSSRPSARFLYNGANVLVDTYSTGGKHPQHFSQVHISWPDPPVRCEIYPESFFTRVGKLLGMQDIEIGSPQFDEAYRISGQDPDAIKEFLSPGVQRAINEIRQFGANREIYVLVSGGTLLIKKLGQYRDFDSLARLTVLSLEIFEQAALTRAGGIDFLDLPAPGLGPAVCQVCGDVISRDLVNCRSCQTAHHKECWNYYGACSTYGCGEKRFVAGKP